MDYIILIKSKFKLLGINILWKFNRKFNRSKKKFNKKEIESVNLNTINKLNNLNTVNK
jgi:hypothetical protein